MIKHAAWKADMEGVVKVLRALANRIDTRIAEMQDRGAGPEHLALLYLRYADLLETALIGEQIIGAADDVVIPVGEAIRRAGDGWVARDMAFNTRG